MKRIDEGFDGIGLAIAGRSNEQYATLPREMIALIDGACGEEALQIGEDLLFERALQNQIVEGCILDGLEEALIFTPAAIVKDEDFAANLCIPAADILHELIGLLFC